MKIDLPVNMEGVIAREAFEKLSQDKRNSIIKYGIAEFSKKSYSEASTDTITKDCGISKGILFHYFGSKKEYYIYCLEQALERLATELPKSEADDFYDIVFSSMEEKFIVFRRFPEEVRFVNMAAREMNTQVFERKNHVLAKYMVENQKKYTKVMDRAVEALKLKKSNNDKETTALSLYIEAIINRYLEIYKEMPDQFIQQSEAIQAEMREYIDFILYGLRKGEIK